MTGVEPWPLALALGLAGMIGASLGFLAIAAAHPDPVVAEDAFAAGLAYNEERRALQRGDALGLALVLDARDAPGGLDVTLALRDRDGRPFAPRALALHRERPAQGGFDVEIPLARSGDHFVAHVPLPLPGRWRLVVEAEAAGARLRRVFAVRGPG